MYELIRKYYLMGIYSDSDLDLFKNGKLITEEQFQEIKEAKK